MKSNINTAYNTQYKNSWGSVVCEHFGFKSTFSSVDTDALRKPNHFIL